MNPLEIKQIVKIPGQLSVYADKRTGFKSIALPFSFPNGVEGVAIITRRSTMPWKPIDEIDSITINFKP